MELHGVVHHARQRRCVAVKRLEKPFGGLWVAQWQGGGLCRFDANGLLTNRVTLPVSNVTNLAFAGPDLRQLYITTARVGLTAVQLQQQPLAGRLFRFDVAIPGVAVPKVDLPY